MKINISKLNLDKLKDWEAELKHLAKHHSCSILKKKYQALHEQALNRIKELEKND